MVRVYEDDVVPAERDVWEVLLAVRVGEMLFYVCQKAVKVIPSELIQEGLRRARTRRFLVNLIGCQVANRNERFQV